jgi:anti-sigma regulatory factor (Ser/Thr protein kinase)
MGGASLAARSSGMAGAVMPVLPSLGRETRMASAWPLRTFLELGAYPGAVPCARLHARAVLWEWGLAGLTEQAELLVSELVTNAIQASRRLGQFTAVRLWLLSDEQRVLILVWDASPQPPLPQEPDEEIGEGGRGLMLVDAISDQWSWYSVHAIGGKVVWALCLSTPASPRESGADMGS